MARTDILLAEDEETDVFLLRRALKKAGVETPVHTVANGLEAVDFLSASGKYAGEQPAAPALVVTDLKMPIVNGFELIAWLRERPEYQYLRIVVLSSSDEPSDRQRCSRLGANAYFMKPSDLDGWHDIVEALQNQLLAHSPASSTSARNE